MRSFLALEGWAMVLTSQVVRLLIHWLGMTKTGSVGVSLRTWCSAALAQLQVPDLPRGWAQ